MRIIFNTYFRRLIAYVTSRFIRLKNTQVQQKFLTLRFKIKVNSATDHFHKPAPIHMRRFISESRDKYFIYTCVQRSSIKYHLAYMY